MRNSISESAQKIYVTTDYSVFKSLIGNRDIEKRRIEQAKKGFLTAGKQLTPILVNEKYEVIEGQARLKAAKELEIPIEFIIKRGATVKDAILLNTTSTKWSITDYIKSYASQGNQNYKFLLEMIETHPLFSPTATLILVSSNSSSGAFSSLVREGEFTLTIEDMIRVRKKIDFCYRFVTDINRLKGPKYYWIHALGFCYDSPLIDNEELKKKLLDYIYKLTPASNVMMAIEQLEWVYNYHSHREKIYISNLYKEHIDKKKRSVS